eukprot:6155744-Pyramimonas_sp.AAC.1
MLIFDARVVNCSFRSPPSTRLPTPSAFASLEVPGGKCHIASGDLETAFYHMEVPAGMSDLFSLPVVDAG